MLSKIPNNILSRSLFALIAVVLVLICLYLRPISYSIQSEYSFFQLRSLTNFHISNLIYLIQGIVGYLILKTINSKHHYVENADVAILFFYIVGLVSVDFTQMNLGVGFGLLALLFCLQLCLNIYNQKDIRGLIFFIGLVLGLGCLFFFPVLLGLIVVLLTTTIFRPFSLKNLILLLIGVVLPFTYYSTFSYLLDLNVELPVVKGDLVDKGVLLEISKLPAVLFIILSGGALAYLLMSRSKFVVRQRNQFIVLTTYVIIMALFTYYIKFEQLVFFLFPLNAIFIAYLHKKMNKKWVLELFCLLLFGYSIWLKLY